jgi:hypothetical protein
VLGDRIQSTALDVLEALIEATYTHDRRAHLAHANLGLEKLRTRPLPEPSGAVIGLIVGTSLGQGEAPGEDNRVTNPLPAVVPAPMLCE